MNAKELIEQHKIPCGPMSVSVDGTCRRRLRDHLDVLLDKLTRETHPEGADRDILEMEEEVNIPEPPEPEETREERKAKMLEDGELRLEVKKELEAKEKDLFPDKFQKEDPTEEQEPSREERKKEMIEEGKLNNEVKKVVKRHEDRIMGNSKMLQNQSGKINKR